MTRLFLRFFLGVLLILTAAWLLQSWLYGQRLAPRYAELGREVYFGGIRVARQKYKFGQYLQRRARRSKDPNLQRDYDAVDRLLGEMKDEYEFPVRLHDVDAEQQIGLEEDDGIQFCRGADFNLGEGTFIMARIDEGQEPVLLFGPLPNLPGPPTVEVVIGIGAILGFTALGIALLLRPVVRQLRLVESAADQISAGDLSARVQGSGVASSKLVRAFNKMAGQTESMVRSQKELLQAVSHELRTPLSRIHFAADLIRTADEEQREGKLQAMESAADDLDKIVGELLTYARAENPEQQAPTDFMIGPLLTALFEKQRLLHPGAEFRSTESVGTARVRADSDSFERVLSNLISNAARSGASRIEVSAEQTASQLVITVDDNGPGIPVEDRERIFEPFVRLDTSGPGVGLGLAIVRRIVLHQGGSIEVLDSPAGGCRMQTTWSPGQPDAG